MKGTMYRGLLDVLFPPRCYICGAATGSGIGVEVCHSCMMSVIPLQPPLCGCCGLEMGESQSSRVNCCTECLAHAPPFRQARSCFRYSGAVSDLLQRLKFGGDTGAAAVLGELARHHNRGMDSQDYDYIIPVPLHPDRLRQRGHNQAQVLARQLFPGARAKIAPRTLIRIRDTVAQTSLDGQARRANLSGAFALAADHSIRDLRICLVDDVLTTGTTVMECARTLLLAGAATVDVWTVARA